MTVPISSTIWQSLRVSPDGSHLSDNRDVELQNAATPGRTAGRRWRAREIAGAMYQWATCLVISALVLAQLTGAVWNSSTSIQQLRYGQEPQLGTFKIVGTNDVPYADRVVACIRYGNGFEPRIVSSLLADEGVEAFLEDSTGTACHGYRLVQRRNGSTSDSLDSAALVSYRTTCNLIASTIDSIFGACEALGYTNLTRDNLRVVESATSSRLFRLRDSLPILLMPYWDNAQQGRHAIPTWDGDACVFRLEDAYFANANGGTDSSKASFRGVNQTVRHARTMEWLKRPGGVWRNGWYEDLEGDRWFSDVTSSTNSSPYYMMYRLFDMRTGLEVDCPTEEACLADPRLDKWGSKFTTADHSRKLNSITISNGSWYGLFRYEAEMHRTVRIVYDWETLVSNLTVGLVLIRWIMSLVALYTGVVEGEIECFGGGLGCVAGSKSFDLLLFSMVPQLKMMLAAFWTVGCRFEGEQQGLSESWFTIYPAIAQFMLMYFSLLNVLAKILRRRMSDALFTPSVASLCLLHMLRRNLAASGWLKGVDGRVSTVVFSDEVTKLRLMDFLTTDIAWRMNGRVTSLFIAKWIVLGINLLPLLTARSFPVPDRGNKRNLLGIEKALGVQVNHVGGLGISPVYLLRESIFLESAFKCSPTGQSTGRTETIVTSFRRESTKKSAAPRPTLVSAVVFLNSYELIRLGYLVFGDRYVVTFDEWDLLSSMAPFRDYCHLWNHRVLVWTLDSNSRVDDGTPGGLRSLQRVEPEMWRLDDTRLQRIPWWRVSSCAIQC